MLWHQVWIRTGLFLDPMAGLIQKLVEAPQKYRLFVVQLFFVQLSFIRRCYVAIVIIVSDV